MAVDPLIELHDVNEYYGELHVLQDIDPTVGKGEDRRRGSEAIARPPAMEPRDGMTKVAEGRAPEECSTDPRSERAKDSLSRIFKH